jgi:hypothetical protein
VVPVGGRASTDVIHVRTPTATIVSVRTGADLSGQTASSTLGGTASGSARTALPAAWDQSPVADLKKDMKHSKMMLVVLIVITGWLVTSLGAHAQQADTKGTNVSTDKGKEGGAATGVSVLNEAAQLVRYARENESPIAMLTAVQMIERVRYQENSDRIGAKKTDVSTQSGEQAKSDQAKTDQKEQNPAVTFDTQC